ncbi:MAG TPA: glycoside hydrolase family 2, partial [Planctomycetota bacterium]|nr:glycoside hydrolase family 2 [Planctomycetota bacterium]
MQKHRHLARLAVRAPLPPDETEAVAGEHGYPRPLLRRANWQSLNGTWDFALDPEAAWTTPSQVSYTRQIRVPFAPETARSGVEDNGLYRACWYRRTFQVPELAPHERLLLHFGAVDYEATVWVEGAVVARHEGGYAPFHADITEVVRGRAQVQIVVRA